MRLDEATNLLHRLPSLGRVGATAILDPARQSPTGSLESCPLVPRTDTEGARHLAGRANQPKSLRCPDDLAIRAQRDAGRDKIIDDSAQIASGRLQIFFEKVSDELWACRTDSLRLQIA